MMANDLTAISLIITSLATLLGVVVQLVNSFRNSKKINATHDIAMQTMQQTSRVYLPTAQKDD
jgi:hypothetical protein